MLHPKLPSEALRPERRAHGWTAALVVAGMLLGWVGVREAAAAAPIPASPTSRVTDGAGVLSTGVRDELEKRLATHERATGGQVLLWIGRNSGGVPLEEFASRAFAAWRVGRRGLDDGVVIFVLTDERRLRIEVGYGLEPRLPDAVAARVLREAMVPALQRGDWDGAAKAGVDGVLTAIGGATDDRGAAADPVEAPGGFQVALWVLGGLVLLALFIWRPSLALHLLFTVMAGGPFRGHGRGTSSASPFRGGGGRSGGGGASSRW